MKAQFLRFRPAGINKDTNEPYPQAFIYVVKGSSKELDAYIENQGEFIRYLQPNGKISDEETNKPVYYSNKPVGKNPTLTWKDADEDYDTGRYFAEISYEDALQMSMMQPSSDNSMEEEEEDKPAPKPEKPKRGRK
jgi:hypothetical protein